MAVDSAAHAGAGAEMRQLARCERAQHGKRTIVPREAVAAPQRRGEQSCTRVIQVCASQFVYDHAAPADARQLAQDLQLMAVIEVVQRERNGRDVERSVCEWKLERVRGVNADFRKIATARTCHCPNLRVHVDGDNLDVASVFARPFDHGAWQIRRPGTNIEDAGSPAGRDQARDMLKQSTFTAEPLVHRRNVTQALLELAPLVTRLVKQLCSSLSTWQGSQAELAALPGTF